MVEGVLAVDKDLRVTFCNHSFARTVGARLPGVPGMPLLELVRDPGLARNHDQRDYQAASGWSTA